MNSFIKASEIINNNPDIDNKIEKEIEDYHLQIMKDYDLNIYQAFASIFSYYYYEFLLSHLKYTVYQKDFRNKLNEIKMNYMNIIDLLIKNKKITARKLLDELINQFSLLYTYDLKNKTKASLQDTLYELKKLQYILIYNKAFIDKKVIIQN